MKNPYDRLKIECLDDVEPVEATALWPVTDSCNESIVITTAVVPDGRFVYGYIVQWHHGGVSAVKPSAERGLFRSQREAKLHAVGFMSSYLSYFLPETQAAIRSAENSLLQASLFE